MSCCATMPVVPTTLPGKPVAAGPLVTEDSAKATPCKLECCPQSAAEPTVRRDTVQLGVPDDGEEIPW